MNNFYVPKLSPLRSQRLIRKFLKTCLRRGFGRQAKVKEYERQIDQMVYKLYGLTEEEIKIVEEGLDKLYRRDRS